MTSDVNVADVERWASALGGAALSAFGIQQSVRERSVGGAILAATGATLIYRGASGHCPVYATAGVSTARGDTRSALGGSRGTRVEDAVTINRPVAELYRFWRDFEHLPHFMQHLESVRPLDERRSHWVAKAPGRRTVEWDAEIIEDVPDRMISWRTIGDSDVISAGSVHFRDGAGDRGAVVHVKLQYAPPGGRAGSWVAWALGEEPGQQIHDDLRRLKQLLEAGEVPTIKGQPRGQQSVLNYD